MSGDRDHWNAVYGQRDEAELTWYEAEPMLSFEMVSAAAAPGTPIIDVGGGVSRLVDRLLAAGLGPVSVLDLSEVALAASRARLGTQAVAVTWICADVAAWTPDRSYGVWHDRAVLQFLTDSADQDRYFATMDAALEPGGTAILASFAEDGPASCSGLPVQRYAPQELTARLQSARPDRFEQVEWRRFDHRTPLGRTQKFQVSVFQKTGRG